MLLESVCTVHHWISPERVLSPPLQHRDKEPSISIPGAFLHSCLNYLYLSRARPVRNKTLVSYKTVVSYTAAFKDAPPLLVLLQGRAGADGARGMPGETGTKVTSLWCHSFYESKLNLTPCS